VWAWLERRILSTGFECPLDSGTMHLARPGVIDPYTGESFAIWSCDHCGFGQTVPRPDDIGRYYAPDYHGDRHGASGGLANRRRLGFVSKTVGPADGRRLVDIGCGNGSFMEAARQRDWEVAGTELNALDARARGLRVESTIDQLEDFAPVDVATLWHSLEHIPDPPSMIRSVRSNLKPDGVIIIAVPNFASLQSRMTGSNWLHLDVPRHLNHFTKSSITVLLGAERFEIVRSWNLEFEYDIVGWSQSLLTPLTQGRTIFFDVLTHRAERFTRSVRLANLASGIALSAFIAPIVPFTTLAGSAATLIVAAQLRP
jgi:2-polyprenyl-3-methyl-5-hydroxy-6-metoxy-1,4-benzoquinol methylase